ncbi:hypothetical protein BHL27_06555 [Bacillus cereus]|uniref:hypothetical protein n=1 Tax=Bacillus cereus TaxID=1396 RepID=UPI0009952DA3|nr:hypothetical protein [Bacillus cereus]OPA02017.1 hypothetical protein BHL27_06555 [Bacillus cereus]
MTRCIYCNATEDLSDSDIIPDGLTNAKITNKNVCRIPHNNNFSNQFESYVINSLATLRDKLDIKTKSNKYPETEYEVSIGDFSAKKKGTKNSTLIGEKVLSNNKKNMKVGPLDIIEQIAKKIDNAKTTELDINPIEIETKFRLEPEVFFNQKTKRLMAKIAYEWYCRHNNIDEFYSEFKNITDYICDENKSVDDLVTYIKDPEIYSFIDNICESGSHMLFLYTDSENAVRVVISFFGICVYNVKLLDTVSNKFKNNFMYQEFQVSSNKITVKNEDVIGLIKLLLSPQTQENVDKIRIVTYLKQLEIQMMKYAHSYLEYDNDFINFVINRYIDLFNVEIIHIRGLKRFVKDLFKDKNKITQLNPNGGDSPRILMYYCLFLLGIQDEEHVDISLLKRQISERINISYNECNLFKSQLKQMHKQIIETEGYIELLNKGANKVQITPLK